MRSTRSRVMAAFAAPVLALTLAACGGDSDTDSDADNDSSSDSSSAAEEEPSDEGMSPDELADALSNAEPQAMRFEMTADLEGENLVMSGEMVPNGKAVDMLMSMETAEGSFEIILIDNTMYMGLGDGTYFKSEMDESMMGDVDPSSITDEYADFSGDSEFVGTEELDGETVQHYMTTITGKDAKDFGGEAELNFFIDEDNRLTFLTVEGVDGGLEMDLFDFGATDIEIVAPPKEAVISGF